MRKLQALGVMTLGLAIGAASAVFGTRTEAQGRTVDSMEELNARFVIGDLLTVRQKTNLFFYVRFIRDRQTGDCYVVQRLPNADFGPLTKTDDNACDGL